MTTNHDTDTSEDDSLMAQANEQLERELLQSQKPTEPPDVWYLSASSPATSKTGLQLTLFGSCIKIGTC
jgi:hypothetical protein